MKKDFTTVQIPQFINKTKSYNTWIRAGYKLFALEGPEGIQIERLARILDLNKSGFYHYFGSHETYFEHLMQHHVQNVDHMMEIVQSIQHFTPEFALLLADHSIPVLAQKQLQRACHIPLFANTYVEVNKKIDSIVLSQWADFIEIPNNPTLALRYLVFVRDLFYARVTPATLNFEFVYNFGIEAKEICDGFKAHTAMSSLPKNQCEIQTSRSYA
jgi:AcrR family transcriptional regulator